jgi:hypothetical protein
VVTARSLRGTHPTLNTASQKIVPEKLSRTCRDCHKSEAFWLCLRHSNASATIRGEVRRVSSVTSCANPANPAASSDIPARHDDDGADAQDVGPISARSTPSAFSTFVSNDSQ